MEGMVLAGHRDPGQYGQVLGSFMDRTYEWLFACRRRDRDSAPANEDRVAVMEHHYGPGVPGGFVDPVVSDAYREWLSVRASLANMDRDIAEAEAEVQGLVNALMEAKHALATGKRAREDFIEHRRHYLPLKK